MDLGKNRSHVSLHQTLDPQQEKNRIPEVIGTWSLRNREQLRKRKAEAQEKQNSQWQFGEKKCKRQRTGKGNQRGRKKQQSTELKPETGSQLEKEMMEKALAPTEKENELPLSVVEASPLVDSPQRVVPEKNFPATGQESIRYQEGSCEFQETTVQNHPFEMCQDMAEDLSPKMCQEISVIQDHSSKMCHDMAEPEDLSPKMCQEIGVVQERSSEMCHDEPEDLSPKMGQEASVAKAIPSKTHEDMADMEERSLESYPKPDVPKGCALETDHKRAELMADRTEPGQGTAGTESFLPKVREIAVTKDLFTYQETVEPEHFSHKASKEISVPKTVSQKTSQETPAPEEYPSETRIYQGTPGPEDRVPGICQETPGPEDLSTKTYQNKDVPEECFPVPDQEAGGPQGWDPKACQEDAKDVYTFPRGVKEKPKAREPETPVIPNAPQGMNPESGACSYAVF